MKEFLRNMFRPFFLWLGYTIVGRDIEFDDNLKGLKRRIIGIYASMNHSLNSSKSQVWSPIVSEKRQIELAEVLAKAKQDQKNLDRPTRSEYIYGIIAQAGAETKKDAEIIWILDILNYELGVSDGVKHSNQSNPLSKLFDAFMESKRKK